MARVGYTDIITEIHCRCGGSANIGTVEDSDAGYGLDAGLIYGVLEGAMVALVLVGVHLGEVGDGVIELGLLPR
jgi:hypothetical protein